MLTKILTRRSHHLLKIAAILPLFIFTGLATANEPVTIEEFPELIEACEPFQKFLFENTIEITKEIDEAELIHRTSVAPAGSHVLAFEENSRFMCATIQTATDQPMQYLRRILFIKPSLLIIDQVQDSMHSESVAGFSFREEIDYNENLSLQATAGDAEKSVRLTLAKWSH